MTMWRQTHVLIQSHTWASEAPQRCRDTCTQLIEGWDLSFSGKIVIVGDIRARKELAWISKLSVQCCLLEKKTFHFWSIWNSLGSNQLGIPQCHVYKTAFRLQPLYSCVCERHTKTVRAFLLRTLFHSLIEQRAIKPNSPLFTSCQTAIQKAF